MHVDRKTVSSEGFMFNIVQVLLRLCEPIMDMQFSKLHLIDPHYYKSISTPPRVPVHEDTLICSDTATAASHVAAWRATYPELAGAPVNFVSDIFYTSLAGMHYGTGSLIRMHRDLGKEIEELMNHVKKMRSDSNVVAASQPMAGAILKRFEVKKNKLKSTMMVWIYKYIYLLNESDQSPTTLSLSLS